MNAYLNKCRRTLKRDGFWPPSEFSPSLLLGEMFCFVLFAACSSAPSSPPSADQPSTVYTARYLFIDHLYSATAESDNPAPLSVQRYEVGYDRRRVLLQPPPSTYRFPDVPAPPGSLLHLAPIIAPEAWTREAGPVTFTARCRQADGSWGQLLTLTIAPTTNPADQRWHDQQLSLGPCAKPITDIELSTTCQDHDTSCHKQLAAWGRPQLEYERSFVAKPTRLALLISIDTLRPDRLGVYGASRQTSPHIDRLGADGIVFETAIAPAPWTIPSHASLLTSTYPQVHNASSRAPIAESLRLLPETLSDAGWQTAGFVDSSYVSDKFGFDRGYDHYDDQLPPYGRYRKGAVSTHQRLLDWLSNADEEPTFIFWHIMDVHGPYWSSTPFGGMFRQTVAAPKTADPQLEHLRLMTCHDYLMLDRFSSFEDLLAAYDEGIAEVDNTIGGLLQILREVGLYEEALIVVTSDHGESFLDHDVWVGHGVFLTDDELRVPLIIKLPGNQYAGTRIPDMVSLLDIAPSFVDVLGIQPERSFQGRSLVSPRVGAPESVPQVVFGQSSETQATFLRTPEFKYISPAQREWVVNRLGVPEQTSLPLEVLTGEQLYDLHQDPQERNPLTGPEVDALLTQFRTQLREHARVSLARRNGLSEESAPEPELSEQEVQRLRSLGYVH